MRNVNVNTYLPIILNAIPDSVSILDFAARNGQFGAVKLLINNKAITSNKYKGRAENSLTQAVSANNSEAA